jgi:hypothetical protein
LSVGALSFRCGCLRQPATVACVTPDRSQTII